MEVKVVWIAPKCCQKLAEGRALFFFVVPAISHDFVNLKINKMIFTSSYFVRTVFWLHKSSTLFDPFDYLEFFCGWWNYKKSDLTAGQISVRRSSPTPHFPKCDSESPNIWLRRELSVVNWFRRIPEFSLPHFKMCKVHTIWRAIFHPD